MDAELLWGLVATEERLEAVAAILKDAGWKATGDGQWDRLHKALPELAAALSVAQGQGFVMVPRVPTDEMELAFLETWYGKRRCIDDGDMADCYTAMLAAAPAQPDGVNRG